MTDFNHRYWDEAVAKGHGAPRMGGNPNMKSISINSLTPQQIEMANNIEQNGYFIPPKTEGQIIQEKADKAHRGLGKFFGAVLGDPKWIDEHLMGGAAPISERAVYPDDIQVDQEQLAFNPGFETIRSRIFRETPEQQKQRLNQKVVDYMRFRMHNPNFLFNDYIDDELRDIRQYKKDRFTT